MRGWLYWRRKTCWLLQSEKRRSKPTWTWPDRFTSFCYLPPLYLPDWNSERLAAWTREYLAVAEPKEWSQKAVQLALAREQGRLTKRQLREYRQAIGDHDHLGLQENR